MQYKHISKEERRKIAEELGRSRSTIRRELKRSYEYERAQKLANKRLKGSKMSKISKKTCGKVFGLFKILVRNRLRAL